MKERTPVSLMVKSWLSGPDRDQMMWERSGSTALKVCTEEARFSR